LAEGPAAFSSEKQNEPLSDDDRRFLPEWIQYYDDEELKGKDLYVVGFCDPSLGKQGGDYSAIITLGMDTNRLVYVLDADLMKRHPDIIAKDVIYKHFKYSYKQFGVETVQFQEFFKDTLITKAEEEGASIPIIGVKTHSDKILRIQSLQPDIKNGRVKFRRDQQKLIEQLINFPSADHDDGPDALEGALNLLGKRSAVGEYYKELAHGVNKESDGSFIRNQNLYGVPSGVQP
jgi:predicted phage terminase large subunit-like protein